MALVHGLYDRYIGLRRALAARATPLPLSPREHFDPAAVRRVLIVCTGLIGDTLMSLPAIAAAKALFPSAEHVGLVTAKTRSLLAMAGCLDRFIICDTSPLTLRPAGRLALADAANLVFAGQFDLAVIFLGDDFAPLITRAQIPHRVFVAGNAYAPLATALYDIGDSRSWGPDERLHAWRVLGLEPQRRTVTLQPPPDAIAKMVERVQAEPDGRWMVVHPFGRTPDQRWPLGAVREFMRLAEDELGLQSVIVGENPAAAALATSDARFRLVGRLTLEELAALLSMCSCVVTTDSGPFHITGVLGRPGIGLFRASRPEHAHRYSCISPVVAPDVGVCQGHCLWTKCRWSPCRQMSSILPETVLHAVQAKLRGGRAT